MTNEEDIRSMKVAELKIELAKYNLPQTGKKDELIERLLHHITSGSAQNVSVTPVSSPIVPSPQQEEQQQETNSEHPRITSYEEDEATRRAARASRFGIPVVEPSSSKKVGGDSHSSSLLSDEARLRRIQRFGTVEPAVGKKVGGKGKSSSVLEVVAEQLDVERLKARQARFGVTTSEVLAKTETEEAKLRRMERFGTQ